MIFILYLMIYSFNLKAAPAMGKREIINFQTRREYIPVGLVKTSLFNSLTVYNLADYDAGFQAFD
jgi:hypothetical protein